MRRIFVFLISLACVPVITIANADLPGVDNFINEMTTRYGFDKTELYQLFAEVEVKPDILRVISRPAEKGKPWHEYRRIFLTPQHIQGGVAFWKANQASLTKAKKVFGVAPEIIVAIIGVESRYGGHTGGYRVMDSLSTLAFRYPPRGRFFRQQLMELLLLAREEKQDPLYFTGSYAGAMGLIQFMPDSFRSYAIDFDKDGRRDIWQDPTDAIGSVANFLKRKGDWQADAPVATFVKVEGTDYQRWLNKGSKPSIPLQQLGQAGIQIPASVSKNMLASVFTLEQVEGPQVLIGFRNFYALMRYNPSPLYAMAVYELAEAIKLQLKGRSS